MKQRERGKERKGQNTQKDGVGKEDPEGVENNLRYLTF